MPKQKTHADELFLEQLREDPEFAAYLRANPHVAADLGIGTAEGRP
jgi:hypothetical protein